MTVRRVRRTADTPPQRVPRQAAPPAPVVTVPCCEPTLVGAFANERLVSLTRRHLGKTCAPKLEPINVQNWLEENGIR